MKLLVISDIHGRKIWEDIITDNNLWKNNRQDYKIIFLGDYFDSFNISGIDQISNFKKILNFKKNNSDKVILLLGNHDYHYLKGVNEHYSGYQSYLSFDIEELLMDNLNLFQICYIENKFLFSHAGISKSWLQFRDIKLEDININLQHNYKIFGFSPGKYFSSYGDEIEQGPLWIRPNSLRRNYLENYIHVVGHTHQSKVIIEENIILTDTYDTSKEYLIIENNKPYVKNLI